jgi:hypothetical protein
MGSSHGVPRWTGDYLGNVRGEWWFVPAAAIGACFYAAIPICIFTAFIIACRAFGRKNDTL